MYLLARLTCCKIYVGQTELNLNTRFKARVQAMSSNRSNSGYAQHILQSGDSYGSSQNTLRTTKLQITTYITKLHIRKSLNF